MILNVYIAFILAAVAAMLGARGLSSFAFISFLVATFLPLSLGLVTTVLFGPSPRRDGWVLLYRILPGLLHSAWITLFAWYLIRHPFILGPGFANLGFAATLIAIAAAWWPISYLGIRKHLPRRCPSCQKWSLIRPESGMRDTRRRSLLFEHFWCVSCGVRRCRRRRNPRFWEDASDRSHDESYGLVPYAPFWRVRGLGRESRARA